MAAIEVNGGAVEYEFLGEIGAPVVVVTPGGRFSKDVPGFRRFAEALASGGLRVLLWDRPNTGQSDVQLYGATESHMRADTLRGLLTGAPVGHTGYLALAWCGGIALTGYLLARAAFGRGTR